MSKEIKTALIVDDEDALREIISEVLGFLDIKSIAAEDGVKAVELAKENKEEIDLFLIDLFMPNMSGEETYEKLNELLPERPVIFMSGYDQDSNNITKNVSGQQHFLKKPFGIGELKDLVSSISSSS